MHLFLRLATFLWLKTTPVESCGVKDKASYRLHHSATAAAITPVLTNPSAIFYLPKQQKENEQEEEKQKQPNCALLRWKVKQKWWKKPISSFSGFCFVFKEQEQERSTEVIPSLHGRAMGIMGK